MYLTWRRWVLVQPWYLVLRFAIRQAAAAPFAELRIVSPVKGKVKDVSESVDQTFAAKVLGEGIAVDVEDGNIYAPVDGTIMQVAETGHAITMELADGVMLLIHCGVDTVKLGGKGFQTFVKDGQRVRKGTPLLQMDIPAIQKAGYPTQTMMVFELDDDKEVEVTPDQEYIAVIRSK